MDLSQDFYRAILFDRIDPTITAEAAQAAAAKVRQALDQAGRRNVTGVAEIGDSSRVRYHVMVLVEDPLPESEAPAEKVDGVYVSIDRVNSLDHWLGPKNSPSPQP